MKTRLLFIVFVIGALGVFIWYWNYYQNGDPVKPQCLIYAVFGRNLTNSARDENSIFVSIDPESKKVKQIGPLHKNQEYQGIDIDPQTGLLYTNTTNDGVLYILDPSNGNLMKSSKIPYIKSNSLAFHPKDGSLWAWPENRGIIKIDVHSGEAVMRYESKKETGALAWNSDGSRLYIADEESQLLYMYDPSGEAVSEFANNLIYETTGLATLSDNLLLGGSLNDEEDLLTLFTYDLQVKRVVSTIEIQSTEHGLEGLTWPIACGRPF